MDHQIGRPITREEAILIAFETLKEAEKRRDEYWEKETASLFEEPNKAE